MPTYDSLDDSVGKMMQIEVDKAAQCSRPATLDVDREISNSMGGPEMLYVGRR